MKLPFGEGYSVITAGQEEERQDKLFVRWVIGYQFTMSFSEFKSKLGSSDNNGDNRTAKEILDDVKDILG